tara:strand:+ start:119 stop:454 length:336 start_codon:yes stop_codon:yes gene_type:complete
VVREEPLSLDTLTYEQIAQIEKNLSEPWVQKTYTFNEMIVRLLCQSLRQNRYLADMIGSADMRSRLAFGNALESKEKMEKLVERNKKNFEFLINKPKKKENGNGKQKGISV